MRGFKKYESGKIYGALTVARDRFRSYGYIGNDRGKVFALMRL